MCCGNLGNTHVRAHVDDLRKADLLVDLATKQAIVLEPEEEEGGLEG